MRRTIWWAGGVQVITVGLAMILAVTLWVAAVLLAAAPATPAPQEAKTKAKTTNRTVSVLATQAWTDTGLNVKNRDHLRISANGVIKIAASDPGKKPMGDPNCVADNTYVAPGLRCYALIGSLGNGPPFAVYAIAAGLVSLPKGQKARLYLGVNDQTGSFGDNSGSWTAYITRTR
jgi:hypothetical protein